MPPEADWVRSWLSKADDDLLAARRLLAEPPVLADIVAFHAQQAVEKLLKAFLVHREVEFEKVHTIRYLLDLCARLDGDFESLRDAAESLTRFAVVARYPVPGSCATEAEARSAVTVAERVHSFIWSRIPERFGPPRR